MIALVDYGAGNLTSVAKGLRAAGADLRRAAAPSDLAGTSGTIVPGVGHFAATSALHDGWRTAITRSIEAGVPFLGICLGMQWLFDGSEEAPGVQGLGTFSGLVTRMPGDRQAGVKIPHVGWNGIAIRRPATILDGIPDGGHMYFTHAFAAPVTGDVVATADHGAPFAAVVERERVFGVQFHPEKSGVLGLRVLRNFVACCQSA